MKRFFAVLQARNLEFLRDHSALAWNISLPMLLVLGFAFLFSSDNKDLYKVGVYNSESDSKQTDLAFFHTKYIQFIPIKDRDSAVRKVEHHQLDMLFDVNQSRYWINSTSPKGYILERVLLASRNTTSNVLNHEQTFKRQTVAGKEIRYVDWLLPGILATNMMFSCLFGIGYVIVRYRKNGVLKRLKATPLTSLEFLSAQVISRLLIIMGITIIVYIGCDIFIDFQMLGSYATLFLVFVLGALCLISLGLLTAARITSEELSGGIINLLSWPMMLLSGVWFSLEGTHPIVKQLAQFMPLTHIIEAARAIMNDGAGLMQIYPHLLVLVVMSLIFLTISSLTFRWE